MPTTFHSCLAKGVPAPRLRYPNGQEGPARKIELVVPGTLKWLIHPLWSTFDTPCESVFDLHRLMAALAQPVVDCLFDPASPLLRRRGRALRPFCERLFEIGTLDALAALVYCGYEAVMANDLAAARAVERTLRQRLPDWPCLRTSRRQQGDPSPCCAAKPSTHRAFSRHAGRTRRGLWPPRSSPVGS